MKGGDLRVGSRAHLFSLFRGGILHTHVLFMRFFENSPGSYPWIYMAYAANAETTIKGRIRENCVRAILDVLRHSRGYP